MQFIRRKIGKKPNAGYGRIVGVKSAVNVLTMSTLLEACYRSEYLSKE